MKMMYNYWLQGVVHRPRSTVSSGLWTAGRGPYLFIFLFLFTIISSSGFAQNIVRAEYFFDTDPGIGNGTSIALTPTGGDITFTSAIPTLSLSAGFHQLAIRIKESGGSWSEFESRGFYITTATADVSNLTAAEYFIDNDPGHGNGTAIPITSGATASFVLTVPTTSLSNGFHFLAIRTKDINGRWGTFEGRGFYISTATTNSSDIVAAEYFFDADPGNGNGISIPVTPGSSVNFTASLPSTGLPSGFHFLAIRTKGADGRWGVFESRGFYVSSSTSDVANIAAAEYFFDTDPGVGNGQPIPITAGANINFTVSLPATGLSSGFHFLAIRTQDLNGKWGEFESRGFYVSPSAASAGDIVAAEYFIDTDPGEDNGTALTVTTPGPTINQIFSIDLAGVPSGSHILGFRVKSSEGIWSEVERASFDILSCIPPTAPIGTGASRCGVGTVTLLASGASGAQVYHWYEDNVTTTLAGTGSPFTTPSLSATKNYYVSIFDPATTCESSRSLVIATVSVLAKPTLNVSGTFSFCEGNSVFLSAPTGFAKYSWSSGDTTQTIIVKNPGSYSVMVANISTCFSPSSDPVSVIIIAAPVQPVIQVTGDICSGGSVVLSAPSGFEYLWSNGSTRQDITATQVGSYSVSIRNTTGCLSIPSDPIVITNALPASISLVENILVANSGDSYQWYSFNDPIPGATKQSIEIDLFEYSVHSVEVTTNGCSSRSEDFEYLITTADEDKIKIKWYPNPIVEEFTIESPLNISYEILIIDMLGRERITLSDNGSSKQTISLKDLQSGSYVLMLQSNQIKSYFKIVKQ